MIHQQRSTGAQHLHAARTAAADSTVSGRIHRGPEHTGMSTGPRGGTRDRRYCRWPMTEDRATSTRQTKVCEATVVPPFPLGRSNGAPSSNIQISRQKQDTYRLGLRLRLRYTKAQLVTNARA